MVVLLSRIGTAGFLVLIFYVIQSLVFIPSSSESWPLLQCMLHFHYFQYPQVTGCMLAFLSFHHHLNCWLAFSPHVQWKSNWGSVFVSFFGPLHLLSLSMPLRNEMWIVLLAATLSPNSRKCNVIMSLIDCVINLLPYLVVVWDGLWIFQSNHGLSSIRICYSVRSVIVLNPNNHHGKTCPMTVKIFHQLPSPVSQSSQFFVGKADVNILSQN